MGQVLLFAFTHKKTDPVDILLFEWRLTALEHKCTLEKFSISKRRLGWGFIKILKVKG